MPTRGRARRSRNDKLPELLRPFFWEYDFDELTWQADRAMIIERLLSRGSWSAWRWLRDELGDGSLRDFLALLNVSWVHGRSHRAPTKRLGVPCFRTARARAESWADATPRPASSTPARAARSRAHGDGRALTPVPGAAPAISATSAIS
ncbi:DUF6922 domain-containing protein [Sorangium sp. So ce281]|uniref:DUF6922 domain-containing protein n=1 Tax=Sorangium sp. So ce281 TaxID=3133293 RepID=UPI003F5F2E98